jgi:hypothetical protein
MEQTVFNITTNEISTHTITREDLNLPPLPVVTYNDIINTKLAALATLRFEKETAGITLYGSEIATDRESQSQLNSAYTSLRDGFITSTPWKGQDGVFIPLTLQDIVPIAAVVAQYVSGCFASEEYHTGALNTIANSSTYTDNEKESLLSSYDMTTNWPSRVLP